MSTGSEHAKYLRTIQEIKDVLMEAQSHRSERPDVVIDYGENTLAWVAFERHQATDAVNRLRARMGKGPINQELVFRADLRACGHVDYTQKFAIYCADLVHDHFVAGSAR